MLFSELKRIIDEIGSLHEAHKSVEVTKLLDSICESGLTREKADDHLKHKNSIKALLNWLSSLLQSSGSEPPAIVRASAALIKAISTTFEPHSFFLQEIFDSRISLALVSSLSSLISQQQQQTEEIKTSLKFVLQSINELSFHGEIATQMALEPSNGILSLFPSLLVSSNSIDEKIGLEIVWNILELCPECKRQTDISDLAKALLSELKKPPSSILRAKELLVICSLIADIPCKSFNAFATCGLLEFLICVSETTFKCEIADGLDIQRLAWSILSIILENCDTEVSKMTFSQQDYLFSTLLSHVGNSEALSSQQSDPISRDLANRALQLLCILCSLYPQAFKDGEGITTLSTLLVSLSRAPGGTVAIQSLLPQALRLACQIAKLFPIELGSTESFPAIVSLLLRHDLPVDAMSYSLSCISNLCRGSSENKTKLHGPPMHAIASLLRFDESDPQQCEEVVIAAIDCAWASIVDDETNASSFTASGGVENALALASACLPFMRPMIVGFLNDLSHSESAKQKIASAGKKISGIMCQYWVDEQNRLGVTTSHDGALAENQRPLLSGRELAARNKWREARMLSVKDEEAESPAGSLVISSRSLKNRESRSEIDGIDMRPTIHCLSVSIGDAILNASATSQDLATLAIVRAFEGIELGQAMRDVHEELYSENTTPIASDAAMISSAFARADAVADVARSEQRKKMDQQRREQRKAERQSLKDLVSHKL